MIWLAHEFGVSEMVLISAIITFFLVIGLIVWEVFIRNKK